MCTFAVGFLGCKVSMVVAQAVRERLVADGHTETGDRPEVHVISTCCVTAEAVAKSRKAARRAARDGARVFVTGCAANLRGDAFADLPAAVTALPLRAERTPEAVSEAVGAVGCVGGAAPPFARTRAYLKIQDGCSFGCSFCVIPSVRGTSRSRTAGAVLAEARRRAGQGHPELVLTGINLGCFRDREAGHDLASLLTAVAATPGIRRVRLSSIEVNHLGERLLEAVAATPGAAPHLHVPLQSGDDGVLATMRRRYTAERFLDRIERARAAVPGLNLTTDVIVGHPAEGDAAFRRTLQVVGEAGFTAVHVFPYSPRPSTADAGADPVPAAEKRRRSQLLREAVGRRGAAHRRAKLGRRERVLVEEGGRGVSADYTPFRVPGGEPGALATVLATAVEPDAVVGTMCA